MFSLNFWRIAYKWKPEAEPWQILIQMNQIGMDPECLYRPIKTLSFGERTRVMLAVLFSVEGEFLLIDEPTNHLDSQAREIVKGFLSKKKGFILVSHDRDLLDAVCDHVLVLNRKTIEVQTGNFSSWWENKEKADAFAKAENEKHLKEISKLKVAADRAERWADKNEGTKIGFDPTKEHDRCLDTRAYILLGLLIGSMIVQRRMKPFSSGFAGAASALISVKYWSNSTFLLAMRCGSIVEPLEPQPTKTAVIPTARINLKFLFIVNFG